MGSKGDREAGEPRFVRGCPRSGSTDSGGNRAPGQPAPASSPGCRYAIRIEGLLDVHWSEWLEGMTLTHEEGGVTRLEGPVIDQAALHGLLNKLRDLRLTIVTVERLKAVDTAAPSSGEPPESAV
jgi:hypothetical protein